MNISNKTRYSLRKIDCARPKIDERNLREEDAGAARFYDFTLTFTSQVFCLVIIHFELNYGESHSTNDWPLRQRLTQLVESARLSAEQTSGQLACNSRPSSQRWYLSDGLCTVVVHGNRFARLTPPFNLILAGPQPNLHDTHSPTHSSIHCSTRTNSNYTPQMVYTCWPSFLSWGLSTRGKNYVTLFLCVIDIGAAGMHFFAIRAYRWPDVRSV